MKVNNNKNDINFTSNNMPVISKGLYALNNNDMLKAAGVDFFCTDTQRTMLEYKNRGKNAGIEMGFREYTGTFIVEFSAALFAFLTSKIMSKNYKPDIKVNPSSWVTNKGLDTFNSIYKNSDKTPRGFIKDSLNSIEGVVGSEIKKFSDTDKEKAKPVIDSFVELITTTHDRKSYKKQLGALQDGIAGLLGADNNIIIKSGANSFESNLQHAVRDIADTGKNIFFTDVKNSSDEIISKLKTVNKARTGIAIPLSMGLAIKNQFINRMLTKKRTGIDNFVGENGYEENVAGKNEAKKEKGLLLKKLLSAGAFAAMFTVVTGIKKPQDLVNKLEFTGPATTGTAIKTIYGTLILGRIFASKDSTELRETDTRDFLGFLNWLVLGDFVTKGVAQAFDPKRKSLFNSTKEGSGVKHWLYDLSVKSQKEIIAQGGNVRKNLRNLNIAQAAGIAYSALMLGFLLPKFNIWMTKRGKKDNAKETGLNQPVLNQSTSFTEFLRKSKTASAINL